MNRRLAIRNMALIMGSVAVLPSCLNDDKGKPVVALKTLKIDADQETLVNNLTETILPKTDTPGARDLGINLFVFKMLDDCTGKEDQEKFLEGLKDFDDAADKKYGKGFNEITQQQRTEFVTALEKSAKDKAAKKDDKPSEPSKLETFYWMVKGQTVFGYTTSQYFMTKQVVYELVPGRWNPMFPVKKKASA